MLKKYRPITPGTRQLILPVNELLTRAKSGSKATVKPTKALLTKKKRTSGRNNNGHITCRHKGGGHKRHYRLIDFKRSKRNLIGKIVSVNIPSSLQNEKIGKHLVNNLEAICRANDCKEISGWANS